MLLFDSFYKNSVFIKYLLIVLVYVALIGFVQPGFAGVLGENIRPYIGYSYVYDDNLFRLSDDFDELEEAVNGINQRSEQIQGATIGLDVDIPISQQHLILELESTKHWYKNYSKLDHNSHHYLGRYNWQYGSRLSGAVGASYDKWLNGFENFILIRKDLITRKRAFLDLNYQINLDWAIKGGYSFSKSDHSISEREGSNLNIDRYFLDVRRKTRKNNYIGVKFELLDGKYPDRVRTVFTDDQFKQYTARALAVWEFSAISLFNLEFGYTNRKWENISEKDFSTPTGLLKYTYRYSEKLQAEIALEREVRSVDNRNGSFTLDDSAGVYFNWLFSDKINVQADFEYVDINYQGEAGIAVFEDRHDKDRIAGLALNYAPFNNTVFSLGYHYKKRTSNIIFADFDDSIYSFDVDVSF